MRPVTVRDLARGSAKVNIGEAVGLSSASAVVRQSPARSLTLRTFHIAGAAQLNETSHLEAISDGRVELRDMPTITDKRGRILSPCRQPARLAVIDAGRARARDAQGALRYGADVQGDGEHVKIGDRLPSGIPFTLPVMHRTIGRGEVIMGSARGHHA